MRRLFLGVAILLLGVFQAAAQGNTYPLEFIYDANENLYVAQVEVQVAAGDTLETSVTGGEQVYFYIYTDTQDIYEGETLADFTAEADGTIFIDVVSTTEASGEMEVIGAGSDSGSTLTRPPVASGSAEAGEFTEGDCPFDTPPEVNVTCGTLTVPENRLTDTGATIQLAIAIIPAVSADPLPDPIFYLEGGPGGSALAGIDSWYTSPYRSERDIVLLEQRGTGFSEPSLNCPEMDEDETSAAVEDCRDRLLAEGVDLTAYNSSENAADVEALRLALGYDQINLYGISYGTRLALTVMRDQPQGIRAVIIDSVYPPNVDTNYSVTTDTYELISMMFADCAAQPDCADAFPDLEARFYDALDAIGDNPPQATNADGETIDLTPDDVINRLSEQLKTTGIISAIPASLEAFISGDYDTYMDLATNGAGDGPESSDNGEAVSGMEPPEIDDDSEGMNMSVQCNEEMPFMTLDEAIAIAQSVDMPDIVRETTLAGSQSEFEGCDVWPAGESDPIENEPVVSDIPTLVLAAQYDTATPPWWADLAAGTLSSSFDFHFPMVGHGVIDGGDCPVSIGLAFLDDPTTEPDTSCIATMNDQFYIP